MDPSAKSKPPLVTPLAGPPIFLIFLRLGLTSFGGPIAHLAYFRSEFVERRRWLSEQAYAELVALCMFLPGPASSQVGMGIGLMRGGIAGAIMAWLGFTLPSAVAMAALGLAFQSVDYGATARWVHGLEVVTVAIVAQALWGMARTLCPDRRRMAIVLAASLLAAVMPGTGGQLAVIAVGGILGWALLAPAAMPTHPRQLQLSVSQRTATAAWSFFVLALLALPLLARSLESYPLELFSSFYRAGALVFGGGHVVLPLLHASVVPPGWVGEEPFLAGYGLAQAMPGPLFTFAGFLGAVSTQSPAGWGGASIALLAIFLPAFLLIVGAFPFWQRLQHAPLMRRVMSGINAAVVGLLLAAFYDPVWTHGIRSPRDFVIGVVCAGLLMGGRWPPWVVVPLATLFSGLTIIKA